MPMTSDTPSIENKRTPTKMSRVGKYIYFGLVFYGLWIDFFTNDAVRYVHYVIAFLMIAPMFTIFPTLVSFRSRKDIALFKKNISILLMVLFIWAFNLIVVRSVSDLYVQSFRSDKELTLRTTAEITGSGRSCKYQLRSEFLNSNFPRSYLCISKKEYNVQKTKDSARFTVRFSDLGVHFYELLKPILANGIDNSMG